MYPSSHSITCLKVKFGNDGRIDLYDKDTAALQLRKEIFTETHKMIVEHNNNGVKAFALEHNIFSIMVKKIELFKNSEFI